MCGTCLYAFVDEDKSIKEAVTLSILANHSMLTTEEEILMTEIFMP